MRASGFLDSTDAEMIELFASSWGEYRVAKDSVDTLGVLLETVSDRGYEIMKQNPACAVAANAWKRCRSLLHDLGVGPRNDLQAGQQTEDPFEALLS